MLNGLTHIPAIRAAALAAAGAGLVVGTAAAATSAATDTQARGCPMIRTLDAGTAHHSVLFRPAGCL